MKNLYTICGAVIVASWVATIVLTCTGSCGQANKAAQAIIDCTKLDEQKIGTLLAEFAPVLVGEAPDWQAIETKAIAAGRDIGGCALAEFVQRFTAGTPTNPATVASVLPPPDATRAARAILEHFRAHFAGNATFHTPAGEL